MSIIDPKTGCTLHPDVQVGSQLTWRELSGPDGCELYDPRFHRPDHPQLVVRRGEVIEIVEDDYGDWLLVKFTDEFGVEYETDLPLEWWDGVISYTDEASGIRHIQRPHPRTAHFFVQIHRE